MAHPVWQLLNYKILLLTCLPANALLAGLASSLFDPSVTPPLQTLPYPKSPAHTTRK